MKNKSVFMLVIIFAMGMISNSGAATLAAGGEAPQLDNPVYIPLVMMNASASTAIVIDHRHTDASQIPDEWITQAKQFVVHYAHTSHGSQILSGLTWLEGRNSKYNVDIEVGGPAVVPADTTALRFYDGNNY